MSFEITQINREIAEIEAQIKPLAQRVKALERQRSKLESLAFIRANNVTKADVEWSDGDGKPWFQMITNFADWLRETKCQKRFCEWNDHIYFTAEIMAGIFRHEHAPGHVDELE